MTQKQFVCANLELSEINQGIEKYECTHWTALQSPSDNFAIDGTQALQLSALIALIFLIVKSYKIVMHFLRSL